MRKLLALLIGVVICSAAIAQNTTAQNTTDPDQVVAQLKLWTKTDADPIPDPVYYGEMTDWQGGHMACLEVAFIKYESGVLHYSFKMWAKHNGSCEYNDQTTRKVDNSPTCVADSEKPNPRAATTTLLTKKNIDVAHSVFRTMDFPNRRAGQLLPAWAKPWRRRKRSAISVPRASFRSEFKTVNSRCNRRRIGSTDCA